MVTKRVAPLDLETTLDLVKQLVAWRNETDPDGGNATEAQKQYKAGQALLVAGILVDSLVDWAFHHYIGVTLAKVGPEGRKRGEANAHRFEELGRAWQLADPVQGRQIVGSLVRVFGVIPGSIRDPLSDALSALNLGEVKPLLSPTPAGRWQGAHSLAQARKLAVMHVFFRWGRKTHTKKRAIEEVANALGVSAETIRTWERRWLPEVQPDVEQLFAMAKRAGALQRRRDEEPQYRSDDKVAGALCHILLVTNPLVAVATEHRRAQRSARKSGPGVG